MLALQLAPLPPLLESGLVARCEVYRWFDAPDREGWLRTRAADVRIVVTSANLGISPAMIARLPKLELIAVFGVGLDAVDVEAARRRGVRVTNTPDVLTDDVADLALGLTLAVLRNLSAADRFVRNGDWSTAPFPLSTKVSGRRFGIVGLGRIGKAIAARLAVLGPVAYTGTRRQAVAYAFHASVLELARACSILVIAASANPATKQLVGRPVFDALGPDGYVINVSRGALINEQELIAALAEKRLAGAALDVYADEPRVAPALRSLPNVVLTPHIGSATRETRDAMTKLVLANLDAHIAGIALPSGIA